MHKRSPTAHPKTHALPAPAPSLPALALVVAFAAALALLGGASRADALSQVFVRSAAVITIAFVVATRGGTPLRQARAAVLFTGALLAVMTAQLIPLPPSLWAALPGHSHYIVPGLLPPWRPVNLTPDLGWNAILALLPAVAVLWLQSAGQGSECELGLSALIWVAVASALLGCAQLAGGPESELRYYQVTNLDAPTGFFANRNHQAALLSCALPALAIWARGPDRVGRFGRRWPPVGTVAAIDLLLGLVLIANGSRAGLVLGGAGLAIQLVLLRRPMLIFWGRIGYWQSWALVAAAVAVAIGFVVLLGSADRFQSFDRLRAGSEFDMRAAWFGPSLAMVRTFFPWGSGFGSFAAVFPQFERFDQLAFTYANEAHDDVLQFAIEGGAAGVVLAFVYAIWWGSRVLRWWQATPGRARELGLLGATVTGLLAMASVLDYPLRTPLLSALFMLSSLWLLGGADSGRRGAGGQKAFTPI